MTQKENGLILCLKMEFLDGLGGQDSDAAIVSYPHYWHGYLVFLKPLLLFFKAVDLKMINMIVQISLLCYVLHLMGCRYRKYMPAFVTAVLCLNPWATAQAFQYASVYYIMLVSMVYVLKKRNQAVDSNMIFFLVIGIVTVYVDFLTFPLVALYFPMLILITDESNWKSAVKHIVVYSLCWGIGYVGMWAGKWIIGSILLGENLFAGVAERTDVYLSMNYEGAVTYLQIIARNMNVIVERPVVVGIFSIAVYLIWKSRKIPKQEAIPFMVIAIAPFVWYVASGTHSYIHYWFTYRELCISIFAVLAALSKGIEERDS